MILHSIVSKVMLSHYSPHNITVQKLKSYAPNFNIIESSFILKSVLFNVKMSLVLYFVLWYLLDYCHFKTNKKNGGSILLYTVSLDCSIRSSWIYRIWTKVLQMKSHVENDILSGTVYDIVVEENAYLPWRVYSWNIPSSELTFDNEIFTGTSCSADTHCQLSTSLLNNRIEINFVNVTLSE